MQQQVRQQKLAMTQLDDAAAAEEEETPAPATAYDDQKFGTAGNEVGHHPHPPLSAPTASFPSFYTSSPLPFLAPRPFASRSLCLGATSLSVLRAWPNPHHPPLRRMFPHGEPPHNRLHQATARDFVERLGPSFSMTFSASLSLCPSKPSGPETKASYHHYARPAPHLHIFSAVHSC